MGEKSFSTLYKKVVGNQYDFGTGTWAVDSPKIKMELDEFGAYHPVVNDSSVTFTDDEVSLFEQTCLSTSSKNESDIANELFGNQTEINFNKKLGYYSGLYIGHVTEGTFRSNGSSGGMVTWICSQLLANDLIDGVIHVKATGNTEKLFEYGISRTESELEAGAKTKYYPVEYSQVIQQVREIPGRYAVVGLPSYIMELRLLVDQDPVLKERLKYMIGLVCGHQKTTKFAEFLAWQCGIEPGHLTGINFRKKQSDSPASQYAVEVTGVVDGKSKTVVKKMKDLTGGNWGQGMFKLRASDFTDDVMNETADVTFGDAWLPEYTTDSEGNNIIVVRNSIIKKLIEQGILANQVKLDRVDEETIYRSQSSHFRHTQDELTYRLYEQNRADAWVPAKRVEPSKSISLIRRKIQDKRCEICLKTPFLYEKAVKQDDIDYYLKHVAPLTNSYKNLYRIQRIENKFHRLFNRH